MPWLFLRQVLRNDKQIQNLRNRITAADHVAVGSRQYHSGKTPWHVEQTGKIDKTVAVSIGRTTATL
jgi:hypothetical protein